MDKWEPINFKGRWSDDPRDELLHRARVAQDNNDSYVAIPVKLAIVCGELRECAASTVMTHDEDGELPEPITILCRKPRGHAHIHYNGYVNW